MVLLFSLSWNRFLATRRVSFKPFEPSTPLRNFRVGQGPDPTTPPNTSFFKLPGCANFNDHSYQSLNLFPITRRYVVLPRAGAAARRLPTTAAVLWRTSTTTELRTTTSPKLWWPTTAGLPTSEWISVSTLLYACKDLQLTLRRPQGGYQGYPPQQPSPQPGYGYPPQQPPRPHSASFQQVRKALHKCPRILLTFMIRHRQPPAMVMAHLLQEDQHTEGDQVCATPGNA